MILLLGNRLNNRSIGSLGLTSKVTNSIVGLSMAGIGTLKTALTLKQKKNNITIQQAAGFIHSYRT